MLLTSRFCAIRILNLHKSMWMDELTSTRDHDFAFDVKSAGQGQAGGGANRNPAADEAEAGMEADTEVDMEQAAPRTPRLKQPRQHKCEMRVDAAAANDKSSACSRHSVCEASCESCDTI